MGKNLPFLDILLMNNNSILSTLVYHKLAAEPYVVPFMSNYPEHVVGNVIQTGLARAVRYSPPFLSFIDNEHQFLLICNKFLGQPTARQSQLAMSAVTANIDSEQQLSIKNEQKQKSYGEKLFIHYTYEQRIHSFK
jgi:hypothetical protein